MAIMRLTNDLKPGMRLTQDILNKNKILLMAKGAILTEENIKIIKRLGYTSVTVDQPKDDAVVYWPGISPKAVSEIKDLYIKSTEEIKDLIKDVISGTAVTINEAYKIPGSFLNKPGSTHDLLPSLTHAFQLDKNTYNHSINVSLICGIICRWLGIDENTSMLCVVAGLFHDIGKSEANDYYSHAESGYNILKRSGSSEEVCLGVLSHHERENGSGFPNHLIDKDIPLIAKIIAVADTFDKLTAALSENNQNCPFNVLEALKNDNLGLLDTKILMLFCTRTAECYLGEMVTLSNGSKGQIVIVDKNNPSRPVVRVGDNLIELESHPEIQISSIGFA